MSYIAYELNRMVKCATNAWTVFTSYDELCYWRYNCKNI